MDMAMLDMFINVIVEQDKVKEQWHEWTSCEMYGHCFNEDGFCTDCGIHAEDNNPAK